MTTAEKEYLTCAETAKLLRAELKLHFPRVKFSVRSDTYSMGASIRVRWTDGPLEDEVEKVAKNFQGSGFDGMIDLKYYNEHYIDADGRVGFLRTSGTEGSMGVHPAHENPLPAGARRVSLGADFVFCNRDITEYGQKVAMALSWIEYHIQGIDAHHAEREAHDTVRKMRDGETVWQAYRRIHNIEEFVAARQAAVEDFGGK